MITPQDTGRSYDQIAEQWLDPSLDQSGITALHRALKFVKNKGRALDIGCGCNGRFIETLLTEGFASEGLDISERMLALARQRHPQVTFHLGDICTWQLPVAPYDFISAWDSIWHVPLAQHEAMMKKICSALAPGGVFIFTMGGLEVPGEHTSNAMGPLVNYSTLGIPKSLELLTRCGCVCRHLEYDQHPELHVFMIAQKLS